MNITKNLGMLCLSVYLILVGLINFVPALSGLALLASLAALLAGIFILIGK